MALLYSLSHFSRRIISNVISSSCATRNLSTTHKLSMSGDSYATITYVTTPSEEIAQHLSRKLIENRLAACVNIVKGVESIYEWQGQVEQQTESLMIIKSHTEKSQELTDFVLRNHPCECPEVVTVGIESGSEYYLDWIQECLSKEPISPSES